MCQQEHIPRVLTMKDEFIDIVERILAAVAYRGKQYDLGALARGIGMSEVSVVRDYTHLRNGHGLRYVMIFYEGRHLGTVYPKSITKSAISIDEQISSEIWGRVESFARDSSNKSP